MEFQFNPHVAEIKKVSYAKEEESTKLLDCGDGCNPYGCSEQVLQTLQQEVKPQDIYSYPHGFQLKDAIIHYWSRQAHLQRENLFLHNSGMDAITCVNHIFAREGAVVLGITPQFTDYVLNARCHGFTYKAVPLLEEESFALVPERIVEEMDSSIALVYLDNHNNPTGQNVPLPALRKILDKALELRICVIADEAYGDYLELDESAAALMDEYPNLIVMHSLSKGTGLAGMRAAYVVAAPEVIEQIDKVSNPYGISGIGRKLAAAALGDPEFMAENRRSIALAKQKLRGYTGKMLRMAQTLDSCSICLLTHQDPSCDLAAQFAALGVKVVSGGDFDGLQANSVRLRLPRADQEEELFRAVRTVNG